MMYRLCKFIVVAVTAWSLSGLSFSKTVGKNQAQAFNKNFATFCLQRLGDFDKLRSELKDLPKLPPDKAKNFLAGKDGEAWPLPDKNGLFVLALPAGNKFCSVFARRADTEMMRKLFIDLVSKATPPFVVKKLKDSTKNSDKGIVKTLSYEWSKPNATIAFVFILSTNSDENAEMQVLGTAVVVKNSSP